MLNVLIAAVFGLVGVGLGGGLQAWQAKSARRVEADSVLSAIVAEVEALARLMHHRGFRSQILQFQTVAAQMVQSGHGASAIPTLTISLDHNYWATYEALTAKIGLLHPYHADRITRFYTFIKAAHENFSPTSPYQQGMTAEEGAVVLANDLALIDTIMILAAAIAAFRAASPPAGVHDPFLNVTTADDPWAYLRARAMPIDAPAALNPTESSEDEAAA
jgi:hypothetical protein